MRGCHEQGVEASRRQGFQKVQVAQRLDHIGVHAWDVHHDNLQLHAALRWGRFGDVVLHGMPVLTRAARRVRVGNASKALQVLREGLGSLSCRVYVRLEVPRNQLGGLFGGRYSVQVLHLQTAAVQRMRG